MSRELLLVNAWELLLLGVLSKNRQRIFQPKKRDKDYQTWMFSESIGKVKSYFPADMDYQSVAENLHLIREYRNKAAHYYNQEDMQFPFAPPESYANSGLLKRNFVEPCPIFNASPAFPPMYSLR